MLNVLDLFSGIGGFSLGLEWTGGFRTVAFCEIEPYCQAVLRKHWPDVPIYDDVRTLTADTLRRDGIAVDVICGGFPCQDLSFAGKRAGLEGARSGLWAEYARLIGEVRPRFVIVENVPGLLSLGMGRVLGDLAALGYDAVWDCIPAAAVGAPHLRDRVWIVGYAASARLHAAAQPGVHREEKGAGPRDAQPQRRGDDVAHASSQRDQSRGISGELVCEGREAESEGHQRQRRRHAADGGGQDVADAASERCGEAGEDREQPAQRTASGGRLLAYANGSRLPHWRQAGQPTCESEAVWRVAQPEFERRCSA